MHIRPITAADQPQLWELLNVALWDPPPAGPRPREVLEHPDVRNLCGRLGTIDAAHAHGFRRVALTVHPENPAIGLYQKLGFREAAVRRTCHLMIRELD